MNSSESQYGEAMVDANDLLQFKALLLARSYLYTLAAKVFGGVPDEALVDALISSVTNNVLEEYERAPEITTLRNRLAELSQSMDVEADTILLDLRDEYTRVFIGPNVLPASPYESPYRGSHDMAVFQENTVVVRREYAKWGLEPLKLYAVPDDHIALLCGFMGTLARHDVECLDNGNIDKLRERLAAEQSFLRTHLNGWIDIFAASVDTSKAGRQKVLYAAMLRAIDAFIKLDDGFLSESAQWLSGLGEAVPPITQHENLDRVYRELQTVQELAPFGMDDYRLRAVENKARG